MVWTIESVKNWMQHEATSKWLEYSRAGDYVGVVLAQKAMDVFCIAYEDGKIPKWLLRMGDKIGKQVKNQ